MIATGTVPKLPVMDRSAYEALGKQIFTLRNLQDADQIRSMKRSSELIIYGARFTGLLMMEVLVKTGHRVQLVDEVSAMYRIFDKEITDQLQMQLTHLPVKLHLESAVEKISKEEDMIAISIKEKNGKKRIIKGNYLLVTAGNRPRTNIVAKAEIKMSDDGHIIVDSDMSTSVKDIYAAGDATVVKSSVLGRYLPVGTASVSTVQGLIAAINMLNKQKEYFTTFVNSRAMNFFGQEISAVGLTEYDLHDAGIEHLPVTFSTLAKPNFVNEKNVKEQITVKILIDVDGGILGFQMIGPYASQRINLVSLIIHRGLKIKDLCQLEYSYLPNSTTAIDPLMKAFCKAYKIWSKHTWLTDFC